ncbi:MAG: hypothetical protein LBC35_01680 [Coriobacteriales bacterium]|nr:hypothetical protein [Coriobacteriales bacterium]
MFKRTGGTAFVTDGNTLTQSKSILEQLCLGVRFFDIRPVIGNGGKYLTGHYSGMQEILFWKGRLGADGASIEEVVSDINAFLSANPDEIIFLELSHAYNTDSGYGDFTAKEWSGLFTILANIKKLCKSTELSGSLLEYTFEAIKKSGNVIAFVTSDLPLEPPNYIFPKNALALSGSYADSDNLDSMRNDQIKKLNQANSKTGTLFQTSWTLTLQGAGLVFSKIRDLADKANERLLSWLLPETTSRVPNVVYLDNIKDTVPLDTVVYINAKKKTDAMDTSDEENSTHYVKEIAFVVASTVNEARERLDANFMLHDAAVAQHGHALDTHWHPLQFPS